MHPLLSRIGRLLWPCADCMWAEQWADQEHQCPKHPKQKVCGRCKHAFPETAQPKSRGNV